MNKNDPILEGGDTIMAMIYATLILKGKKHVSDVPAVLRNQVVDILKDVLEVEELPEELM